MLTDLRAAAHDDLALGLVNRGFQPRELGVAALHRGPVGRRPVAAGKDLERARQDGTLIAQGVAALAEERALRRGALRGIEGVQRHEEVSSEDPHEDRGAGGACDARPRAVRHRHLRSRVQGCHGSERRPHERLHRRLESRVTRSAEG